MRKEIIKRDISEEKLRNAVGLKIELPKFKGYDSDTDLYTFRTEYEKLVEPYVQRKLWSEVLKINYLSGAALTLVNTIEDIDQNWMRLFKSFGNTNLLLRNKLGALEKLGGLWKAKGDEKIGLAIAGLLNATTQLRDLAKRHNLEDDLYYGGGLETVLGLLGDSKKRRFISENGSVHMHKRDIWNNLVKFLEKEFTLCENLTA